MRWFTWFLTSTFMLASLETAAAQVDSTALLVVRAADIRWQPAPPDLEPGAQGAVLAGDPARSAPFTLRVRLPANYRIAPHRHPVAERLTVLSGTLCFATRDTVNATRSDTTCIGAGSFRSMPAGMVHSDWTTGPVEYQIEAIGPFDLTYVDPEDDRRQRRRGTR